jgi:hypothetical protein
MPLHGGLVARWCVDKAGGAELVTTIVTVGTPHKGSVLALDGVANGVRLPHSIQIGGSFTGDLLIQLDRPDYRLEFLTPTNRKLS